MRRIRKYEEKVGRRRRWARMMMVRGNRRQEEIGAKEERERDSCHCRPTQKHVCCFSCVSCTTTYTNIIAQPSAHIG
eukprot:8561840-Pyramimonas_sp.AAC.1